MSEERKPWERQEWETATAYDRFVTFYLSQDLPRSIIVAYNRYRESKGLVGYRGTVPGTWSDWAAARVRRGKSKRAFKVEGAMSWTERANAWDKYQEQLRNEEMARQAKERADVWAQRCLEVREKQYQIGVALLDRATVMLNGKVFRSHSTEDGKLQIFEPTNWRESDIANTAKVGADLARMATGLPKDMLPIDDWQGQLQSSGMDSDAVFNMLVDYFVNEGQTEVYSDDSG